MRGRGEKRSRGERARAVHHVWIREAFDGHALRPSAQVYPIPPSSVAFKCVRTVRTWSFSARTTTRADLAMREVGVAFTRAFPANDLQAIAADIVMEMFVYIAGPACTDTSEIHIQIPTRSVGIVVEVHHLHTYNPRHTSIGLRIAFDAFRIHIDRLSERPAAVSGHLRPQSVSGVHGHRIRP